MILEETALITGGADTLAVHSISNRVPPPSPPGACRIVSSIHSGNS